MVSMESPSFNKPLVDNLATFLAARFVEAGGEAEILRNDRSGDHLRVRFEAQSAARILLLGHTDTVWPEGEIRKRPFAIEGGRALGPGAFDMKAGILLMWMAIRALRQLRGGMLAPVTVLLTSDEEVGSGTSRSLIEAEARQCSAVLVLEPSLPGGVLKTVRKGVGRFTLTATGKAAHAGIEPGNGINAIEEISRQILKLQQMNDAAAGTTVTVGVVHGGTRSNVVPAEATAEIDVRIATFEEADRIAAVIASLQPELRGARLEIQGSINRPPMMRSAGAVRLFELARSVAAQIGIDLNEGSTGGASDGNFTAALGVPTLDGLGAVGGGAHALDEWVDIASLPERAALVAGLIESTAREV
jgi:glutamate carboxypeptidase